MDKQELRDALSEAQAALRRASEELERAGGTDAHSLSSSAATMLRQRRKRDACFPPNIFGEYEWDMLLVLFSAGEEMRQIDVFNQSGVPQTTGLRIIRRLEEAGLVAIRGGGNIYQKRLVRLSEEAVQRMAAFIGSGG
jgi:uncharacterized membrane protein